MTPLDNPARVAGETETDNDECHAPDGCLHSIAHTREDENDLDACAYRGE
jgi:hypothetical protein